MPDKPSTAAGQEAHATDPNLPSVRLGLLVVERLNLAEPDQEDRVGIISMIGGAAARAHFLHVAGTGHTVGEGVIAYLSDEPPLHVVEIEDDIVATAAALHANASDTPTAIELLGLLNDFVSENFDTYGNPNDARNATARRMRKGLRAITEAANTGTRPAGTGAKRRTKAVPAQVKPVDEAPPVVPDVGPSQPIVEFETLPQRYAELTESEVVDALMLLALTDSIYRVVVTSFLTKGHRDPEQAQWLKTGLDRLGQHFSAYHGALVDKLKRDKGFMRAWQVTTRMLGFGGPAESAATIAQEMGRSEAAVRSAFAATGRRVLRWRLGQDPAEEERIFGLVERMRRRTR